MRRAERARLSSSALGKNRGDRRATNKDPWSACSRAQGSNRFKPIRIRIAPNHFHVCALRTPRAAGWSSSHRADLARLSPADLASFRIAAVSRVSLGPHTGSRRRLAMRNLSPWPACHVCKKHPLPGVGGYLGNSDANNPPPEIRHFEAI